MTTILLFLLIYLQTTHSLTPIVLNGTYSKEVTLKVNRTIEYIIQMQGELRMPPMIKISSDTANETTPLMIMVRQPKQVLSWAVPLPVSTQLGRTLFYQTSRTLCYDRNDRLVNPIVSFSTSSEVDVRFSMVVAPVTEFFVENGKEYEIQVSPSEPSYFFYNFTTNASDEKNKLNFDAVIFVVNSNDSVCMTVSIQNASCPIFDLNSDITYNGFYETVSTKGGITISKNRFPYGFFIVFVAEGDDYDCTNDLYAIKNRTKTLTFTVKPSISYTEYLWAVIATISCVGAFYLIFGLSFFCCSRWTYRARAMGEVEVVEEVTACDDSNEEQGQGDNVSWDETEYDIVNDVQSDREIFLNKPVIYLSDLARKDPRIHKKKSYLYLYNVLTVAVFYGLPVVQLVITYQTMLNSTGQQDLCYYNFLCAHPLGFLSDFNHLFSNIGYVLLGLLFLWITSRRELTHCDLHFDRQYGIPQHYGMFYAMGVALIMEGVLSACYHICPNHTNFQFDSSFMYVVAVLSMVKLYQNRHPDINATAYATFGVLAVAILLSMIGILEGNLCFWILFTIIHIITCLYLTLQIYYMGYWRLDKGVFMRIYRCFSLEYSSSPLNAFKPKYKDRMILLVIGNLFNWALAFVAIYYRRKDFAMYLLGIFMCNTLLYFVFYIIMKKVNKERINYLSLLFLTFSIFCAVSAMYFFWHKSISWALTPAQSRQFNKECALFKFYDYHDIWHFLSAVGMFFTFMVLLTLDDDLSHTHRSQIHVF